MFGFVRKLQQKMTFPASFEELMDYKTSCDNLVQKYEELLKNIAKYMQNSQYALQVYEQQGKLSDSQAFDFEINTFSIVSIKQELTSIALECDQLMIRWEDQFSSITDEMDSLSILVNQLRDLRSYSGQIEMALNEFQEKLQSLEEIITENVLIN